MFSWRPVQARCPTWLEFGPHRLIMWVTLLLCLRFTCFKVDLKHKFPLGFGIFLFSSQLVPVWDLGFCWTFQLSNKLFYRRFPVRLFCSYTVQAPQKWLPRRSWKKRGKKCKGNRLQKHVGGTARQREGGRGERD